MSTEANPTRVFISYARADGADAANALEAELGNGGFSIWRDTRDIDAFSDFSVEIEQAISTSDVVVVCVTPSITASAESFVRREINYAQLKKKPIVLVRLGQADVPIQVNHLTWIEAPSIALIEGRVAPEVSRRLAVRHAKSAGQPETSPMVAFVRALLDDIVAFIEGTTAVLLDIAAAGSSSSSPRGGGLPSSMRALKRLDDPMRSSPGAIGQDASQRRQRIVLHGSPGSGKTTALLVAAREAANAWLEDQSRMLPIFCRARDWNAMANEDLLDWLDRSAPVLPTETLEQALEEGRVTLFLDGIDEIGPWVSRGDEQRGFNPREQLLAMLPLQASVVATCRSDALQSLDLPSDYEAVELEPVTGEQITHYISRAPELQALLDHDESLRDIVQTPLTLGLLTYIGAHRRGSVPDSGSQVPRFNDHLRVVYDFTESRWQHEDLRNSEIPSLETLLDVLGRLATWGEDFDEASLGEAADAEGVSGERIGRLAQHLGVVRSAGHRKFTFFHPSFADCYATLHCWRYLGVEEQDGWDQRLFERIARLDDVEFIEPLALLAKVPFWRGEFGDELAVTLEAIGRVDDARAVDALMHLAGHHGLHLSGLNAVGRFARRCSVDVQLGFVEQLRQRVGDHHEAVHQLVGLGEPGITALVEEYRGLDHRDPMRGQIASYSVVRGRL